MRKINKISFLKITQYALAFMILATPIAATFAASGTGGNPTDLLTPNLPSGGGEICNSLTGVSCGGQSTDVISLAITIINYALGLAGLIAVAFLIYGGFLYIFEGASEGAAEKGKKTIINALIGLVIIILAYVIVKIVVNTVGSTISQ